MEIISASRRTDIPAFYMAWFMNRIRAGVVRYPNPFGGQIQQVSLRSEDVHSIVFWSKECGPLLPQVDELLERGYHFCVQYTINGGPRALEPHVPFWERSVEIFHRLAARTSPRHVLWRFDPMVLTGEWGPDFYLHSFREIGKRLAGATDRCTFSFATYYGKAKRQLTRAGIRYHHPDPEAGRVLLDGLAESASEFGMSLFGCCQEGWVHGRIHRARCIDGERLAELFPDRPIVSEQRPTRPGCGCAASRDIGMYDTCPFGCLYCYANQGREVALKRFRAHDPAGDTLFARHENSGEDL